jgi:type II secretory pathway pseudopilin PulG
MPPAPVKKRKINPHLFSVPLWGGLLAAMAATIIAQGTTAAEVIMALFFGIGLNFALIYWLIALYRSWCAVHGPGARTSPAKAVGFMFIPLFNYYWMFVAVRGLAVDANAFLQREGVNGRGISEGLSLTYCILYVLGLPLLFLFPPVFLVTFVLQTVLIYQWARFNNNVVETPQYARRQSQIPPGSDPAMAIIAVVIAIPIVIAVIGILAAIAIPAFLGQRERARMRMLESNYNTAVSVVEEELGKCSTDSNSVTTDVVAELNAGDWSNPWVPESDAFSTRLERGQVAISHTDLRSLCGTDAEVLITGDARGDGIEGEQLEEHIDTTGVRSSGRPRSLRDRRSGRDGQVDL